MEKVYTKPTLEEASAILDKLYEEEVLKRKEKDRVNQCIAAGICPDCGSKLIIEHKVWKYHNSLFSNIRLNIPLFTGFRYNYYRFCSNDKNHVNEYSDWSDFNRWY